VKDVIFWLLTILSLFLVLVFASACARGPEESCRVVFANEVPSLSGRCPLGSVVVAVEGSTVQCSEVTALCPKEEP
jgi:hypothetical protein